MEGLKSIPICPNVGEVTASYYSESESGDLEVIRKGDNYYVRYQESSSVQNGFTDIDRDSFYYDAVEWAVENEITNGISETEFAPERECTRGQIVTFLYRDMG